MIAPVIAYYRGGDGYALDKAVLAIAKRLEQATGEAPERWREQGKETSTSAIAEHVSTAPMFGGGTVAVITDPGPLLRSKESRETLEKILGAVAPGNALVFIEQGDAGDKRAAMYRTLEAAVIKAGGEARDFPAPKAGNLQGWLGNVAQERGLKLDREAAAELSRRVGAFVTENDVDRQRMGALAVSELDKLALYRGQEPIRKEDVEALVAEVIPDSIWALTDAIGRRDAAKAGPQLDRLLEGTAIPILVTVLHRRLRELLMAADIAARGGRPADMVKAIGGAPFRVQKLAEQAATWSPAELADAMEGLLELDATLKGATDAGGTERQVRLAFAVWVRDHVARGGGPATRR